jgi:predicted N-formylglutamate amidohydrolase
MDIAKARSARADFSEHQPRIADSHYVIAGNLDKGVLLVCDHASNALPARYGNLGLPPSQFERHIAYDIGVEEIVNGLASRLEVPAVLSQFSRLLIDPNRGIDDPTLVMEISDGALVPGNIDIPSAERRLRLDNFYLPYHAAIDAQIDRFIAAGVKPVLISVHSFTPAWHGVPRPWHAGFLWEDDRRCTDLFLQELGKDHSLVVADNEPYSGGLAGDCMNVHAVGRGLAHTLIEIRQDLISDAAGVAEWTERLGACMEELIECGAFTALYSEETHQTPNANKPGADNG